MKTRRNFFQTCAAFVAGCALSVGMAARLPGIKRKFKMVIPDERLVDLSGHVEGIDITDKHLIVKCAGGHYRFTREI